MAALAALALAIGLSASTASATSPNAWTGSGPSSTVVSDGTAGPATFSYHYDVRPGCCPSGTWTFSTTADFTGTVKLPWMYTGLHAFFQVRVGLSAFVGSSAPQSLVNAGPADCCVTPSNGFSYSGVATLNVTNGETYGFTMTGSNSDSTGILFGTLTVGPYLSTTATGAVDLGGTIGDSATLTNTSAGAQGAITFRAYSTADCSTLVHSFVAPVNGDGNYSDPGFTPLSPGTYYWTASYPGDPTAHTLGAAGACGAPNESSTVSQSFAPTLATTATGPAELGGTIADSALLTGTAPHAEGAITFRLYADAACSSAPLYTNSVPVDGDGTYVDPGFVPTSSGTYYWTADYSGDGDANTDPMSEPCGSLGESSLVTAGNDSWTRAKQIDLNPTGDGQSTGSIDLSGQARWYKFDVTPGGDVQVDLSGLPANYDLALFSDIGQAFNSLSSPGDLQKVSAEFGGDAFSPSVFSPSVFSPSVFSPSVFSPSVFSPSVFSPSVFSPSVFSPSVFSPSVFSPSVFSPSVFSPSVFSPSVFSPDPAAYEGAQLRSLLGISANDGTASEHIFADVWNNTGSFYIRVNGRNGTYDPGVPFTVSVHENTGTCGGVQTSSDPLLAPGYTVPGPSVKSLILTDYSRMTPGAALTTMEGKVTTLAGLASVGGTVVDVEAASPRVATLEAQADSHTGCPYAKNLVAGAIKDVVGAYRAQNPGLKYIVIVGDDHVIPFFRYPDTAGLGPELDYVPPVLDTTASEASLKTNTTLSQDAYGATDVLHLKGLDLPIPDLPVGRLVETPAEISKVIDAYTGLSSGVVPTPTSSLVTGYDFMATGAQAVESDLSAGLGGSATNDTLITNQGVAPTDTGNPPLHSWTADQLRTQLLGRRHDLIYVGGHFSANNTLAADYATTVNATELASSSVNLVNSIVFSAGCHSGYTIVNGEAVPNVTQTLDWTEAFAQKGATLIAGTGYQYGDTDFLAYSQRLYANFAHDLRLGTGPVAVGDALVKAKATYLADTVNLKGIDAKSLLESTLYGLPMLSVNLPAGRIPAPTSSSIVTATTPFATNPGAQLGLSFFDHIFSPALTTNTRQFVDGNGSTVGQPLATWLSGPDGVVTSPGAPTLPLSKNDVSYPSNVLRGVGFRGGTFSDQAGITPLTGAPTTELNGLHSPFISSAFYPSKLWTVNYFGTLAGGNGSTELMLTPAQYESDAPGSLTDLQRAFSAVSLRLFYSGNTGSYGGNTPALAAPPTISRIDAAASGGTVTFQAHVVGDPSAGIQQVWVTYLGVHPGTWESLDLTQDPVDSTLWSGSLSGLSTGQIAAMRFVVQAVNGVGLVSLDDNQGSYYQPSQIPPALQATSAALTSTALQLNSAPPSGAYGSSAAVSATLTAGASPLAGKSVTFSIGGSSQTAMTNGSGVATLQLPLVDLPGPYELTAAFNGDATNAGSSASAPFTIARLATSLVLTGDSSAIDGTDTGMTATLSSGGAGLAQKTVAFVLTPASGPAVVQTRITDLLGRASLGVVQFPLSDGYTVRAFFGPGAPITLPDDTVYTASSSGPSRLTLGTSLADLTSEFAKTSAKYLALPPDQQAVVDQTIASLCAAYLAPITPGISAALKAQLISQYKLNLNALVAGGWLTPAQAAGLAALTSAL